jgi:hypothetical protein
VLSVEFQDYSSLASPRDLKQLILAAALAISISCAGSLLDPSSITPLRARRMSMTRLTSFVEHSLWSRATSSYVVRIGQ